MFRETGDTLSYSLLAESLADSRLIDHSRSHREEVVPPTLTSGGRGNRHGQEPAGFSLYQLSSLPKQRPMCPVYHIPGGSGEWRVGVGGRTADPDMYIQSTSEQEYSKRG